jgi:hypothetical protein
MFLFSTFIFNLDAEPQFSGYVENTTALYNDEEHTWTDVASARLEGSWSYDNRGGIELNGIARAALQPLDPFMLMDDSSVTNRIVFSTLNNTLTGSIGAIDTASPTGRNINDLLTQFSPSSEGTGDIESFIRHLPYSSFYPRNSLVLDRALVKLYFKYFDLYVGRQMVGWGTGYAWNPTDVWNRKNPADPTAPKVGVNAMRVEIPFGDVSGLSLVVSPETGLDQTSGGARVKGTIGGYDISVSLIRSYTADAALLGLPERIILGGDAAGQIGDVGVFAEAALINPRSENQKYTDTERLYAQTDIGCYYTFGNGLYLITEYYFNRLGAQNRNNYNLTHLLHMLNGDMAGMGQHYGFAGITKDVFRYWVISGYALGNISDHSVMLLPSIEYSHSENIVIKLSGIFAVGDVRESEFGGVYHSGMLTVTGYF